MGGLLAVAVGGFVVVAAVVDPVRGVGIDWTGVIGIVAVWQGTGVPLQDERERAIERRTSATTMLVAAVALITLGPGLAVLEESGVYEVPSVVHGALLGYALLFVVFGLLYFVRKSRR